MVPPRALALWNVLVAFVDPLLLLPLPEHLVAGRELGGLARRGRGGGRGLGRRRHGRRFRGPRRPAHLARRLAPDLHHVRRDLARFGGRKLLAGLEPGHGHLALAVAKRNGHVLAGAAPESPRSEPVKARPATATAARSPSRFTLVAIVASSVVDVGLARRRAAAPSESR